MVGDNAHSVTESGESVHDLLNAHAIINDLQAILHGKFGVHKITHGLDLVALIARDIAIVASSVPGGEKVAGIADTTATGATIAGQVASVLTIGDKPAL